MRTRSLIVMAVMLVCLGGFALAQEEELPLSNWSAPPYWNPTIQAGGEGEPGGRMVAHAQGMQAQAEALPSSPLPFVAIQPCRIVDTRINNPDGFHSPNFADDESRTFNLPASPDCTGLPATAGAWSVNIQFRPMSQLSFLTAYPTGTTMPAVSTLTASPAAWVQNAAIVPAGTSGAIDIFCQYAGRVVIDINGYYGPQSVVTSLNTLTGDLALAEGANVTITPGAGTLTIAAGTAPVSSVFGRAGAVTAQTGDYTASQVNGLTAGGITLGGAGGAFTQDAANLYWDVTNHRLGLGTTSPSYQLDLTGMARMSETAATGGAATAGVLFLGLNRFLHGYVNPGSGGGNTFVGRSAGNFTMGGPAFADGSYNTGIGTMSLVSNTTGSSNTAIGSWSLAANTTGTYNVAVGYTALRLNTEGGFNTATGHRSLYSNTSGSGNVATGLQSLQGNMTGADNVAVGSYSLNSSTAGDFNTALGVQSLYNSTGSDNTAVGAFAGASLTSGGYNIDIGNSGVAGEEKTIRIGDSSQTRTFIAGIWGVTPANPDALPVVIDWAGQLGTGAAAAVASVFGRTGAVTAQAGDYTASQVTGLTSGGVTFGGASGAFAQDASNLFWDATNHRLGLGKTNPAYQLDLTGMMRMPATAATGGAATAGVLYVGNYSFLHAYADPTNGGQNTFVGGAGNFAMGGPTYWDGSYNTGVGAGALAQNTTGRFNTAVGNWSLAANTTGAGNVAIGPNALNANKDGAYNTAAGYRSLYSNTTGSSNLGYGSQSLDANTEGNFNIAIGGDALHANTTGSNNVAIGTAAGYSLTDGSYNIDIGNVGVAGEGATIRIGSSNQTKTFIAGIRGVTTGNANAVAVLIDSAGQLGTVSSSIRFKRDVADMGDASTRLMELRPVTFRYRSHPDGPLQYGLIAEEVHQVMPELVVADATGQPETVAYHELPAMLLNEVQKQQATIKAQQTRIEALERRLQMLMEERQKTGR